MAELPQISRSGDVAQIASNGDVSTLGANRRLRVALLVIGALVAFTGTIVTDLVKSGLEKDLEVTQSRYSRLQALRVQTYDQVQQARRDAQTALILDGGAKYGAELRYYARYYAWDAANKIKETLDDRVKLSTNTKAARTAIASPALVNACTLPPPPDPHIPTKITPTSEAAISLVGALADPWNCFNDRLSGAMTSNELQISDYRKRIRGASMIATMSQLFGILIAFSKDFFQ